MKVFIIALFSLLFTSSIFSQVLNSGIQQSIDHFVQSSGLENAAISFMAYDLDSNKVLAEYNEMMAIPPASTTKLFTTAAAYEILGKDYRPKTELYHSGTIDSEGILHGDIIVRGLGDPTLGSKYFYDRKNAATFLEDWVALISEAGIKKIKGKILADGSAFGYNGVPDGWDWSDMGNYYGSGPSGCAVYDNLTYLHFSTSTTLNGPTHLDSMTPTIPGYHLDNRVTTYNSTRDNSYIYGAPFSYQRFATGKLPRNRSNFEVKASVPDPELLLAQVFEAALNKDSIRVSLPAAGFRILQDMNDTIMDYNSLKLISVYHGKTIDEIAFWTNHRSVNFFAEQLLCLIGYEKTGFGGTSESAKYIRDYWSPRLNLNMFQTDGCGLSRSNAFSANHFIQLFKYMYKSKHFTDFETSLPTAGKSGTLKGVCRGQAAQGRMKAKSGTLSKVKAYAGYIDSIKGDKIGFALIVNNYNISNYYLVKRMEKVFNAMANY